MAARRLPTRRLTAKVACIVFPATNGDLGRDLREYLLGVLFAGSAEPSAKPVVQGSPIDKAPAGSVAGPSHTQSSPDPADPAVRQLSEQLADVLQAMAEQQEALAELTKQGAQRRQEVPGTPPPLPLLEEKEKPALTLAASFSPPTALFSSAAESALVPLQGAGAPLAAPTVLASTESALAAHSIGAGARPGETLGGAPRC